MQNRRFVIASLSAAVAGLLFAAACTGSDDDNAGTGAAVETQPEGGPKVTPVTEDGSTDTGTDGPAISTGDDDDAATASCLATTPIDQTKYAYVKAADVLKGFCTEDELTALIDYYAANAMNPLFNTFEWQKVISPRCSACIFIDDGSRNVTIWRPIVEVGDEIDTVDVGGCVEHLSGSEDCGKAFQQYEDCQTDGCINTCTTPEEYALCRADPALLTTTCLAATTAVNAACGASNINQYEVTCNSGFPFEGPIRVGCIGTPADGGAPTDGGSDASTDSGSDASTDSGSDASTDSGAAADGGSDAGDASTPDDAGTDAGISDAGADAADAH